MGYYSKLSFQELLDEYFEARLDYWKYQTQDWKNPEIGSILIDNYKEVEAELERRVGCGDCRGSCKNH